MPVLKRLKYSLYMLVATTMIVVLVLGVGEGIGLRHGVNVQGLMFHPLYISVVLAIGYALAPSLHEHVPISGDAPQGEQAPEQRCGYVVRAVALATVGLVLALIASFIVHLLR